MHSFSETYSEYRTRKAVKNNDLFICKIMVTYKKELRINFKYELIVSILRIIYFLNACFFIPARAEFCLWFNCRHRCFLCFEFCPQKRVFLRKRSNQLFVEMTCRNDDESEPRHAHQGFAYGFCVLRLFLLDLNLFSKVSLFFSPLQPTTLSENDGSKWRWSWTR